MSETIQFSAGFYKIIPVETGKALAGVGRILPSFQPVHIGADITTWHIEKVSEEGGAYRFSLRHSYPYVGVDRDRTVIASVEKADESLWRIEKVRGVGDLYSIVLDTKIYIYEAWTLSSKHPGAKIVISPYELEPQASQIFRIVPVHD